MAYNFNKTIFSYRLTILKWKISCNKIYDKYCNISRNLPIYSIKIQFSEQITTNVNAIQYNRFEYLYLKAWVVDSNFDKTL